MEQNETTLKCLNALVELKDLLKYTEKIPLRKFFADKKLNQRIGTVLVNGGIIKNLGSRGLSAKYVWNTIEPNYKMAEEVIKRANEAVNDYKREKRKKDNKLNPKKKKTKVESVTKYQEALIKLEHLLKYTSKVNLTNFLEVNNLSFKIGMALQDLGIIQNVSKSKKFPEYKWITNEPNYEMAKALLNKVNIRTDVQLPKFKEKVELNKIDYAVTKLMFGLINIKTKYVYK